MSDIKNKQGRILPGKMTPKLKLPLSGNDGELDLHKEASQAGNFLLVFFYRGLHCPICKKQLQGIEAGLDQLKEADLKAVAISMDSEARARKSRSDWEIKNLKMAYNLPEETAREWGLYISTAIKDGEPDRFSEPGLFILKPDATLYGAVIQSMPFTRPDLEGLIKNMKWINENDYPARGIVS